MNILLLTSHSIAEFDDLRMLHELGYNVYSIGAYSTPMNPSDDKRPPLPQVPTYPHFNEACERQRRDNEAKHGSPGSKIDWAKADIAPEILDWADAVICHHFPEQWIAGNWDRYQAHGNRIIWRTCGQSNPQLEAFMQQGRSGGLEIVRYSPRERRMGPTFAGEDAVIRFGKEPDEWCGWHGKGFLTGYPSMPRHVPWVGNITQNMVERGDAVGYGFWRAATDGLETLPGGPGSEQIGGAGPLSYDDMRAYLRECRVYLYTGTQPASYTLGLIEAMMTGVPVVSIGPHAFGRGWIGDVFEGQDIVGGEGFAWDDPDHARVELSHLLADHELAAGWSMIQRQRAIDLFGMDKVKEAWRAYLG